MLKTQMESLRLEIKDEILKNVTEAEKLYRGECKRYECLKTFGRMSISVQDERNSPRLFNIKEEILTQGGLWLLEMFSTDEIPFVAELGFACDLLIMTPSSSKPMYMYVVFIKFSFIT